MGSSVKNFGKEILNHVAKFALVVRFVQLKAGEVHILATVAFALVRSDRTSEVRLVGLKLLQVSP